MKVKARGMALHRHGVGHRYGATIRRMWGEIGTTHQDIATKTGITRERVRQIVREMGLEPGTERRGQRHDDRMEAAMQKYFGDLPVMTMPGYTIAPLSNPSYGTSTVRAHQLMINGHLCAIRNAYCPPSMIRVFGPNYVRVQRPHGIAATSEFVLFRLPGNLPDAKGWLVVPMKDLPPVETNVNLASAHSPGYKGEGRWREYLNAWELLSVQALTDIGREK
jgi:hypothetical protein